MISIASRCSYDIPLEMLHLLTTSPAKLKKSYCLERLPPMVHQAIPVATRRNIIPNKYQPKPVTGPRVTNFTVFLAGF